MPRLLPFLVLLIACGDTTAPIPHAITYDADVAGTWAAVVTDTAGCRAGVNTPFSITLHFEAQAVPHPSESSFSLDTYDVPQGSAWSDGERTGYLSGEVSELFAGLFLGTGPWRATAAMDTSAGAWLHGSFVFTAGTDSLYADLYDPEGSPIDSLGDSRNPLFGPAGCAYQLRAAHVE